MTIYTLEAGFGCRAEQRGRDRPFPLLRRAAGTKHSATRGVPHLDVGPAAQPSKVAAPPSPNPQGERATPRGVPAPRGETVKPMTRPPGRPSSGAGHQPTGA